MILKRAHRAATTTGRRARARRGALATHSYMVRPVFGLPATARRVSLCAVLAVAIGACDSRNPAEVSRSRHPEYYPDSEPRRDRETAERAAPPVADAPAPPAAPAIGNKFDQEPGETIEVAPSPKGEAGTRLDLAGARAAGTLQVAANDPGYAPRLDFLFDGDVSSLARSEDINPLVLELSFQQPIALVSVRIFPSYSTYDWAVRAGPDQPRLVVREAAEEQWSRIDLPAPVETTEVRLEIRRLVRDNYVHLNEVELFVAGEPATQARASQ